MCYNTLEPDFSLDVYIDGSRVLSTVYGQGTGLIVLDQVQCIGSESRLFDCQASPFGMSTCDHSMDIGISCAGWY